MNSATYIHGTDADEQGRLAKLGQLTDAAFVRFLELEDRSRVLDVGSGLGNLARQVAGLVPRGEVWGVEQSAEQLAQARSDLPNLHFRQADAHALPFDEGCFDVVYCRYLLEHLANPVQGLREMRRVSKPGGKVFVQENNILVSILEPRCPCFDSIWQRFALLQALLGGDALIGKKLLRLMQEAGFLQVRLSIQPEVHHSGSPTFRPWIENLIGNIRGAEQAFQSHELATKQEIDQAVGELRAFTERDDASAFFYWNRGSGVKESE
ncbi:MAG TPA: methyltransferase domain-containing protein [Gemmataceae bacterium]|jgi:SAM-dependent methyltransferase|nr:methyltransferase domain-containing protein [Gemmataceae bacterium]